MRPELAALDASIEGEVIYPESPEYESVRRPAWAQYENVRPVAVVRCRTPTDVAGSLAVARRLDLEVAPRGGGHCFAGRSATGGLVIDLSPMSSVAESDGIATVGAGARLGEIDERLAKDALAIPAGSCPAVGIAGLTLGGGLGILGRTYGLTSDQLVQAQVVLADGRVVECDERREEGLFWALRGAGAGQFGVVTSFSFRAVPAPDLTCFRLVWPLAKAADLLEVWQSWAPSAPDELAASLLLNVPADPERPPTATLFGSSLGAKDETERLLEELVVGAGEDPTSTTIEYLQYIAGQALSLGARSRRRAAWRGSGRRRAAPRPRLRQIGVLQARASSGADRCARRPPRGPTSSRSGARARLHSVGWRLHPTRSGGDRFPAPP